MNPIQIVSGAVLPTTEPAATTNVISVRGNNAIEITGLATAGSGKLVLLRHFPGLGWRPWKESEYIAVDSTKFGGYFSGKFEVAAAEVTHFILWIAEGTPTATAYGASAQYRFFR